MQCYLCGSTDHKRRDGKVRDSDTLEILECNSCSLVFLSSKSHINDTYYEESNMSEKFDVEQWLKVTRWDDCRRFEFVKDMIVNKNIADFGSGAGGFLMQAKSISKSVMGIELDKKIVNHYIEQGIEHISNINDIEDDSLDIITAFHVVEHLAEPVEILQMLTKKLRKGGRLLIEVPNSNDALLIIYKNKSFSEFTYWSPHLYLYNHKTIELLFKKVNNTNIEFIKYIQRYPLSNHLYWLTNNKPGGHQVWGNFIDSKELTKAYETQLAALGVTDTLIIQISKV